MLRFRFRPCALLRLHDKAALAVEVDPAVMARAGVSFSDGPLETVVVGLSVALSRPGAVELQNIAELGGETLEVGHLVSAGCRPASNELVN